MNYPIKIAHRGYCLNHKSNTMGAFHDAVAHGFDMIEMDIQLNKNNDIIVMHDTFIDCKEVCMQEYAELKLNNPELLLLAIFFNKTANDRFKRPWWELFSLQILRSVF